MIQKIINKAKSNVRLSFLIPFALVAIFLIVTPMVFLFVKSVSKPDASLSIIKDQNTWALVGRSVYLGLIASILSLIIMAPFAFIVARSKSKTFKLFALAMILSPLAIFTVAKVFAIKGVLLKLYNNDVDKLANQGILILGMMYLFSPYMIVPLYSVFSSMPESLLEASHDLGYNPFKTIFKVLIPYSSKAIFAAIAMVFMLAATNIVLTHSLLPEHSMKLIGNQIDQLSGQMRQNDLAAAWGSTLSLITISVMMGVYGIIYFAPSIFNKISRRING